MKKERIHPVHLTDTFLTNLPQENVTNNLIAAEGLLRPSLFRAVSKAIENCTVTLRQMNGITLPSLFFRTDMSRYGYEQSLNQFAQIYSENHYHMGSTGIHLDWGFGQTLSPEILMAYLGRNSSLLGSFFSKQAHFTLGIDPGIKGKFLGDIMTTEHPYAEKIVKNLGGYSQETGFVGSKRKDNAVAILEVFDNDLGKAIPNLKLASFNAIAPTPGTLEQGLEFAIPRLKKGSRVNVALTPIQISQEQNGIHSDREADLDILSFYSNKNRGQQLTIPTNNLNAMQRGALNEYPERGIRNFLESFGPFDTKYSSSGGIQDRRNPQIDLFSFTI